MRDGRHEPPSTSAPSPRASPRSLELLRSGQRFSGTVRRRTFRLHTHVLTSLTHPSELFPIFAGRAAAASFCTDMPAPTMDSRAFVTPAPCSQPFVLLSVPSMEGDSLSSRRALLDARVQAGTARASWQQGRARKNAPGALLVATRGVDTLPWRIRRPRPRPRPAPPLRLALASRRRRPEFPSAQLPPTPPASSTLAPRSASPPFSEAPLLSYPAQGCTSHRRVAPACA